MIWLILASAVSWFVSTLAGGGTPLFLIPLIGATLGAEAVPPVLTLGMLLGHPQRVLIYWKYIDWTSMGWYLPGSIIGAILGAFVFTQIKLDWLTVLLAIFLILSTFAYSKQGNKPSFEVKAWYFLPAGFIFAFLSGLLGSTGPLLNPLYLNYGLVKEDLIATKSAHLVIVHIAKIVTYAYFGALTLPYLGYGLVLGLAALPGNWLGAIALKQMSEQRFQQLVTIFVVVSGVLMLWNERSFLLGS